MGSKKQSSSMEGCLSKIRQKQRKLQATTFGQNHVSIQQSIEEVREDRADIRNFKDDVEAFRRNKGHTKEFENTENELHLVEDLAFQRKRCLETLLYVSEVENMLQSVQCDMEDRALYLASRPKVFESVYRDEDVEAASRMHRDCVYALRHGWGWLSDLSRCLDIHMRNAASYHQFHHEVRHTEEDLGTFLAWLHSEPVRKPVKTRDPDLMAKHIRLVTSRLLDYQGRVEKLCETSKAVHPINYRKELPAHPIKATALLDYKHNEVALSKDEAVTVLDVEDQEKWKVQVGEGKEVEVPAIVLVIPPPDPKAFSEARRLREQLVSNWEATVKVLGRQLLQFLSAAAKETQSKDFQGLSTNQKSDMMRLTNEATAMLRGCSSDVGETTQFRSHMTNMRKILSQAKAGQKPLKSAAMQKWQATHTAFRLYTELMTYIKTFRGDVTARTEAEELVVRDLDAPETFTSKAYFQRAYPMVDIDSQSPKPSITSVKAEIYIHERHRAVKRPKAAPRKKRQLQQEVAERQEVTSQEPGERRESKSFAIVAVIDPRDKSTLTLFQALGNGVLDQERGVYRNPDTDYVISIPEAIALGYIKVESTSEQNGSPVTSGVETQACAVSGVINPSTGEWISAQDAIAAGLLDMRTGKFRNPVTGEELTILDAVKAGLLVVDMTSSARLQQAEGDGSFTSLAMCDVSYAVSGVIDPSTGEELTLQRAIELGIIDVEKGLYRDPVTGETMTIAEAIQRGLIRAIRVDRNDPNIDPESLLTFQQLEVVTQIFKAGHTDTVDGPTEAAAVKADSNAIMFAKVKDKMDVEAKGVVDPRGGPMLSLKEAVERGIINLARAEYDCLDGVILPLQEAAARGLIEPHVLQEILKAYQECSIGNLIDEGRFDPETSLVLDPVSGHSLSLQAALTNHILDPETTYFFDVSSQRLLSLAAATEQGRFNVATGRIVTSQEGELSVSEAEQAAIIMTHIRPEELAEQAEALALLRGVMDTGVVGVKVEGKREPISIEQAVVTGTLSVPTATHCTRNPATGKVRERTPLSSAVKAEKITPEAATALIEGFNKLSLQKAIDSGVLNPKTGQFLTQNGTSGGQGGLHAAHSKPQYVFLADNTTGHVTTLGAMTDQGKFDPRTGKVKVGPEGKAMTLEEAIAKGLIGASLDPDKFVDTTTSLKDLIDSGKVNPRSTKFTAPNGLEMTVRDAIAEGYLTLGSKVCLDHETGGVRLVGEEGVVRALVEVRDSGQWLDQVETTLAAQAKPSERLERLKQQVAETKAISQDLQEREPQVQAALRQAEQQVSRRGEAGEEARSQYSKLDLSKKTLKNRFDSASREAELRVERLDILATGLEAFYFRMDELDQWLDTAIERAQSSTAEPDLDLEEHHSAFKDFVDDVKSKEDEMTQLFKLVDDFRDNKQEIERQQAAYRKCLENLPPIQEEGEAGDLDDEIESLEAKFKDVSRECARQMERLTSLLKNKKTFTDLSDRLTSQLPLMKDHIANMKSHEVGKSPEQDARHLEELRLIKADVIGYDRKLKDLGAAGERLKGQLEEAGMGKEVKIVEEAIAEHKESQQALLADVTALEERADQAVTQQQSLLGRLDGVVTSLEEAEDALGRHDPVSLERERLGQQLLQQRQMNAHLSASRGVVERLAREEAGRAAQDKLTELRGRLDSAEAKAADRTAELERVEGAMADYEQRLGDLDSWLTQAVGEVKARSKGGAGSKAAKAKVDALYEAKAEHEGEMAALREHCKELINDDRITDRYAAKERLAAVESKWNDLTELLVQQVSLEALSEIDGMLKYLDKAENEINTAEPVSVDPETLAVQLKEHTAFNDDLNNKRNAVKEIINKCNRMLRETTNSQTDEIKSRLDSIRTQADIVCQLSAERLQQLEAALPLARHYAENLGEVGGWLEEMETELRTQGKAGDSLDQVNKQHDHLKASQQIIADHKPFLDDLNATGLELMDLCGENDASDIQAKLMTINNRYEALKSQARGKAKELTDAKKKLTVEVTDTMDSLLDELAQLSRAVTNADPVPATPEKLKNEIDENKAVLEDLDSLKPHVTKASEVARSLAANAVSDPSEVEEVTAKEREMQAMATQIRQGALERDRKLTQALRVADKFYDLCADVMSGLRDLKDSLYSQEPPGVDPATVQEQQAELAGLEKELEKASELVDDCGKIGDNLSLLCGDPGRIEVDKQLADLRQVAEDVADLVKDRADELKSALQHAETFQSLLDSVNSWLPVAEHKLAGMRPPSSDPAALHDQIEEIKLFKSQIHPHIVEMQRLNQQLAALRDVSPVAGDALLEPVKHANDTWNDLIRGIADRESKLNDMQVKVGELDHAMDDVINTLEHAQKELSQLDEVKGDPKHIETHMRRLQLLQADLRGQEKSAGKLNKAVDAILARTEGGDSALADKRDAMNQRLRAAQANAKDRENQLHEALRQVKKFLGDLDDMLVWVGDLRMELKANTPFGALPETAKEQYNKFLKRCEEMDGREKTVQTLLTNGQSLAEGCRPEQVQVITDKLQKMRDRWQDTRGKARQRKEKMEAHMQNVSEFHDTVKAFTDWLNKAEVSTRALKYPSKLVPKVTRQIEEHETLRAELEAQAPKMAALERSGTYLKYFGRKQDTVYIKNLLVGIRLRWKKLVRRTDERGRLLQQALREDRRFLEAWKSQSDWIDQNARRVEKFATPSNKASDTKTHMEELKRFEKDLEARTPFYFTAVRLGRGLKDRCTKTDPEREELQSMLDSLRQKWAAIQAIVHKGQNKLDEALLTSGRVSDAMQSLMEWLTKAEESVSDTTPCYGDVDTVSMLIEQHKALQQELAAREASVATMKTAGNVPAQQLEVLTSMWERVNHLSDARENKLKDALKLAEEFQEVVTVMREFLPHAESELKYRPLPEDELLILQLIERHEKFQEEMRSHQDCVERIKSLAEEILQFCHPNGVRFVKYYLTITQTRWDQLIQRTHARADRLQDALRAIQGNAALLEELLAWLTDAHALLSTKERDPVPDDLKVVETLLKEHQEFHAEVTSKNADADRLTKLVSSEAKASPGRQYGSNLKLNEEGHNPRVIALQNKWRIVWRLSVERKKKLQDAYDTLMELESFKNFDFDLWRQRYKNWIQAKKFRITDFFRRQDKDCDGYVSRDEFVSGMLTSKFGTNKTELNAVFDIFDNGRNLMAYKDFIEALKPDRNKSAANKQKSTVELIHDEVERSVSSCQCRHQFHAEFIDEGKYLFGEKNKICLVRFLNSTVMVRVGGGWITLDEFLEQNDPCRAKGRTNFDLRETLLSPDASTASMSSLGTRRGSASGRTSPFPTGASRRRQNDTGYASSNSSAGSHDSSLRRSRVTSSMVNLHLNQGPPHHLHRNPEFGSTGSLSRSKRLSTSSSSISNKGRNPANAHPPTTPTASNRRHSHAFGRAITPTPGMSASASSRSRPTTPTAFTPRTSSTPQRPSSTTPTSQPRPAPGTPQRPGSITPTRGLGGRTRRLPSTPKSSNPR